MALKAPSKYSEKIYVTVYDVLEEHGFSEAIVDALADPIKKSRLEHLNDQLDTLLLELKSNWDLYKNLSQQKRTSQSADETNFLKTQYRAYNTLDSWMSYNNISAVLEQKGSELQLDALQTTIENLIMEIYNLIQEILVQMNPQSETTDYAIYFSNNNTTYRGVVSRDELHNGAYNKYVYIGSNGAIMMKKEITKLLLQDKEKTSAITNMEVYQGIIKIAIEEIMSIRLQRQMLTDFAAGHHLGAHKDNIYDAGETVALTEDEIMALYARYSNIAQQAVGSSGASAKNTWTQIYAAINRGHIAEAYERYIQDSDANKEPNIEPERLRSYLEESLGNDPWYSQGDVNSTQVKSFFDNQDRKMASLFSIITLATSVSNIIKHGLSIYLKDFAPNKQTVEQMKNLMKKKREEIDAMASMAAVEPYEQAMEEIRSILQNM